MTCIAAVRHGDSVLVGGDSAGTRGGSWEMNVRADSKVFRNGPYLFGFTTSFRMGQLLRYRLTLPEPPKRGDVLGFMATEFVDAVRKALKDGGFSKTEAGAEEGGEFVVAVGSRLFTVHSDYQVAEHADAYAAVGCGAAVALGALAATPKQPPKARLRTALRAAERHSAGVRGPFRILST